MSDCERTDAREWLRDLIGQAIWDRLKIGENVTENADRVLDRLASPEARPYFYQLLGLEQIEWRRMTNGGIDIRRAVDYKATRRSPDWRPIFEGRSGD